MLLKEHLHKASFLEDTRESEFIFFKKPASYIAHHYNKTYLFLKRFYYLKFSPCIILFNSWIMYNHIIRS